MPRTYNRAGRDAAMARTRTRIVDAIVALHAERGAGDTSYAQIAERADVAVPTVYKYFPSLEVLFDACVGHVREKAPPLGPELFEGLTGAPERLAALAKAMAARHRYFRPWLRWSAQQAAPLELTVHYHHMDEAHRAMIREAIAPAFAGDSPAALIGLLASLLDFRTWQTLVTDFGLTDAQAAEATADAVRRVLAGYITA
jgi:TetR/AcrR family transcriptional repressor of uid operon